MIMQIQPLGERVLLKSLEAREMQKGKIYIPESSQESRKEGEIIAVGHMDNGKQFPVQQGDRVLYGGYSHEEFEINGVKHILVELKDILAKLVL